MQLAANISLMFTETPMPARFAAAKAAGFDAVEIQFPDEQDMDALRAAQAKADMPVALINVGRGRPDSVGLGALPGEEGAFAAAVETAARNARVLGAGKVNVLAGRPPTGASQEAARATLVGNLRLAAERLGAQGLKVMVEPVNPFDVPGFFLPGLDAALDIIAETDHPNLFLQFDLYHMARTEPDLTAAIARAGARIGHVQFADAPGRGAPGSGGIDFAAAFAALHRAGYDGVVAAEYVPRGPTAEGLSWMQELRPLMRPGAS